MDHLLHDVRHALRTLAARPGFAAVAVLTLGLGIGATTAIFSVVRGVLLRPLPYADPDRVVQIWNPWSNELGNMRGRSPMSPFDIAEMRAGVTGLAGVAAHAPPAGANLTGSDRPERVLLARASASLFPVLGTGAWIGRTFDATEDRPGSDDVVVLSYGLWQRRFGGEPDVLQSVIRLDGTAHRVIGVMPPSFRMPLDYLSGETTDVWKPLGLDPAVLDRDMQWLHAVARLGEGASVAGVNAELATLTQSWIEQGFKIADLPSYYAVPLTEELLGGVRRALLVLFGAVAFVLLIACVNVANLLLARSDTRRAELALRAALGATRPRIVMQLLTESVVLALLGGAAGLLFAWIGVQLLVALEPASIPRVGDIGIDPMVLGFTAVVAVATSLIFGFVPALRASRPDLVGELRTSTRSMTGGPRASGFRGALAGAEVALCVVLLIGAGLMIRTFSELSRIDLGFRPAGVLTFSVSLPPSDYAEPEARVRFHAALADRLAALSNVHSAGAARALPLAARLAGGSIQVEGADPPRPGEGRPNARWQVVTPDYFATLGYTLLGGRLLEAGDRAAAAPVVVVNETMAEMFWPDGAAVGRRVRNASSDVPWFTVVGVVRDVRHAGVTDRPSPTMYFPLEQVPLTRIFTPTTMSFVVRTASDPRAVAGAVREEVRALDAGVPVANLRVMDDMVADALAQPRFTTLLLVIFAAVALLLALIGIYGLLSYAVSQRRREIGIRLALGAPVASVLSQVVANGMLLTALGLAAGLVAAVFLTRLLEGLLYGVQPLDVTTFLIVPVAFLLVAFIATWIPARRARAVDPMLVLRQE
jgi:putative ABC transport system permease protein